MADDQKQSPNAVHRSIPGSYQPERFVTQSRMPFVSTPVAPRTPASPYTPRAGQTPPSGQSSPFGPQVFRTNDATVVFEIGARHLQAGLAGEYQPRSFKSFGTRRRRLAGDYSQPSSNNTKTSKPVDLVGEWGTSHELWSLDTRTLDLGLVGDRIEKAVREALLNDVLLLDGKTRRFVLVLPTLLPHALLTTLLITMFTLYPAPSSITLIPTSLASTFAAGVRSALIIDIGWHDTVVSAIYEFREALQRRSCRAMKLFGWEANKLLQKELQLALGSEHRLANTSLSFDETEEILTRMAWCTPLHITTRNPPQQRPPSEDPAITIPIHSLPTTPPTTLTIPFSHFSFPAETAFFPPSFPSEHYDKYDSHELPLPLLAYTTLLDLSHDIRQSCLPRIIVTGGGSNIPGLKGRLATEITELCNARGWDKVHNYGSLSGRPLNSHNGFRNAGTVPIQQLKQERQPPSMLPLLETQISITTAIDKTNNNDDDKPPQPPAHLLPQISDASILSALRTRTIPSLPTLPNPTPTITTPTNTPTTTNPITTNPITTNPITTNTTTATTPPTPRILTSLSPWSGASLLSALNLRGTVEIQREDFLKHGFSDAGGRGGGWGV